MSCGEPWISMGRSVWFSYSSHYWDWFLKGIYSNHPLNRHGCHSVNVITAEEDTHKYWLKNIGFFFSSNLPITLLSLSTPSSPDTIHSATPSLFPSLALGVPGFHVVRPANNLNVTEQASSSYQGTDVSNMGHPIGVQPDGRGDSAIMTLYVIPIPKVPFCFVLVYWIGW